MAIHFAIQYYKAVQVESVEWDLHSIVYSTILWCEEDRLSGQFLHKTGPRTTRTTDHSERQVSFKFFFFN